MGATAALMGAGVGLSVAGQFAAANANRRTNEYNAKLYDAQAVDSIARGEESIGLEQEQARGLIGAQRANIAAQGINLDSEVADAVRLDTERATIRNVRTIKGNAWREAMGYRAQATGARRAGKYAYQGAVLNATGSLLTGAAQTAAMAQDYRSRNPTPKAEG
jgi:hypothetical protein